MVVAWRSKGKECGWHLVERHGAGMPMPALRGVLAGDCPRRGFPNIHDLCDVHFPELPELFLRR